MQLRSHNKSKRSWWADIRTALASPDKVKAITRGAMDAVFHESLDSEQKVAGLDRGTVGFYLGSDRFMDIIYVLCLALYVLLFMHAPTRTTDPC